MKRSNRLVILVGVLLAVLAFVGIVFILNGGGGGGPTPEGSQEPQVTVLVADNDIAIGEEVTPNKVKTKLVAASAVSGTPFSDPSQLTGRPAVQAVARGGQVSRETVGGGVNVCISCSLLPGEKAVAFQVDRVTGLDFLIQPGDHIDIVMRQDIQVVQPVTQSGPAKEWKYEVVTSLDGTPIVKTVLQNKRVLYVSSTRIPSTTGAQPTPTPGEGTAQQPEITSVVIIIAVASDSEADLIKMAQSNVATIGNLTAILRASGDDVTDSSSTGLTVSELIRIYGVPIPDVVLLERAVTP